MSPPLLIMHHQWCSHTRTSLQMDTCMAITTITITICTPSRHTLTPPVRPWMPITSPLWRSSTKPPAQLLDLSIITAATSWRLRRTGWTVIIVIPSEGLDRQAKVQQRWIGIHPGPSLRHPVPWGRIPSGMSTDAYEMREDTATSSSDMLFHHCVYPEIKSQVLSHETQWSHRSREQMRLLFFAKLHLTERWFTGIYHILLFLLLLPFFAMFHILYRLESERQDWERRNKRSTCVSVCVGFENRMNFAFIVCWCLISTNERSKSAADLQWHLCLCLRGGERKTLTWDSPVRGAKSWHCHCIVYVCECICLSWLILFFFSSFDLKEKTHWRQKERDEITNWFLQMSFVSSPAGVSLGMGVNWWLVFDFVLCCISHEFSSWCNDGMWFAKNWTPRSGIHVP